MAIFKCKMCGGDLEIVQDMSVCECQYCGSKQTLPKLSDDKKQNMYDRAGHFRRNNEYDKAMSIYEQILNEDPEDAESYWSLVLCHYGIEYVEEPVTHRRVPTVNRAQFTSIYADENYKSAIKYADSGQRLVYEAEAKEIEQIQKGILAVSSKEEPFDVFICYKESDAAGRRTPDSVLANDLYHQLTQEGFKVFFSRITLEDKLGSAYEPYIFAALNSAKVMVVLGTKPEYFNAVWVKNEWSRFLALIKNGAKKTLIPAYRDMDPYDLPEEFSHLQAQDMSKLGFMQDLIRGIRKIAGYEYKTEVVRTAEPTAASGGNGVQGLLERAFLFLEDGEFTRADELCEQVLNQEPKNAQAYVGKLMVQRKLRKKEALSEGTVQLTGDNYFQKAVRFAEDSLRTELEHYNQIILDRNKDITYGNALGMMGEIGGRVGRGDYEAANKILDDAIRIFESLTGWKDSADKIKECQEKKGTIEIERKRGVYQAAKNLYEQATAQEEILEGDISDTAKISKAYETAISMLDEAVQIYEGLGSWEDSKVQIATCRDKQERIKSILYQRTQALLQGKEKNVSKKKLKVWEKAVQYLKLLGDYENSKEMRTFNLKRIRKRKMMITVPIVFLVAVAVIVAGWIKQEVKKTQEMLVFDYNDYQEMGYQSDVKIGYGVEKIGSSAFEGDTNLKSMDIPSGVTSIGDCAFRGCTSLESIDIPSSVTSIGFNAFQGCTSLKSIEIPGSVVSIDNAEFADCTGLESVEIQNGVEEIGYVAFAGCKNLKSVDIPSSVTSIGDNAFYGCTSLESIDIPSGVTSIGSYAFQRCTSLKSIEIPSSVTNISEDAFNGCVSLKNVYIKKGSYAEEWAITNGYNVNYK